MRRYGSRGCALLALTAAVAHLARAECVWVVHKRLAAAAIGREVACGHHLQALDDCRLARPILAHDQGERLEKLAGTVGQLRTVGTSKLPVCAPSGGVQPARAAGSRSGAPRSLARRLVRRTGSLEWRACRWTSSRPPTDRVPVFARARSLTSDMQARGDTALPTPGAGQYRTPSGCGRIQSACSTF